MSSPSRKRRLVVPASLATLAVLGVGAITTGAVFTDRAEVDANTFSAGTVDISATPATQAFTVTKMAPGDVVTKPLTVKNDGSLELRYAMTSTATGPLSSPLTLQVKSGVTDCTTEGFTAGGTNLYGSAAPIGTDQPMKVFGDSKQGPDTGDRVLTAGGSEELCVQVTLPGPTTGNDFQERSADVTFTFNAEQTANNGAANTTPTRLAAPAAMKAMPAAGNAVEVSWEAPEGTNPDDLSGYAVQRSNDEGTSWEQIASVEPEATKYTDTTGSAGVDYDYTVQSLGTDGSTSTLPQAADAPEVVSVTYPVAPAAGVSASAQATGIVVNWEAVTQNGVTGYQILRSGNGGGTWATLTTVGPTVTTYTDTTGTPGSSYTYAVVTMGAGSTTAIAPGSSSGEDTSNPVVKPEAPGTFTSLTTMPTSMGPMAYNPTNDSLYVAARGNSNVYRLDRATGAVVQTFTNTWVGLNHSGLAYNPDDGFAYVLNGNGVSRLNEATGATTVITTGISGSTGGLTYNPNDGSLYATSYASYRYTLWRINPSTGAKVSVGSLTYDQSNADLIFNKADGHLYALMSKGTTRTILKVDPSTGTQTVVVSSGLSFATELSVTKDGTIYVLGDYGSTIYKVDATTRAVTSIKTGQPQATGIYGSQINGSEIVGNYLYFSAHSGLISKLSL